MSGTRTESCSSRVSLTGYNPISTNNLAAIISSDSETLKILVIDFG